MKDQIADVFQRHVHQFGFKKTSVDEVAREMRISKKTIYQNFASKEEMLQYVLQRNAQAYLHEIAGQLKNDAGQSDAMERLAQLIGMIHKIADDFHQKNASFEFQFKLEIAEAAYRQAYRQVIADLVAEGVQKGRFRCNDLETATYFVNVLIAESLRYRIEHPQSQIVAETICAVQKILA